MIQTNKQYNVPATLLLLEPEMYKAESDTVEMFVNTFKRVLITENE